MKEKNLSTSRKRSSQLSLRLDSDLLDEYRSLLRKEEMTATDDIEAYIKSRLGKDNTRPNVLDFTRLSNDVERLKEEVGKLIAS